MIWNRFFCAFFGLSLALVAVFAVCWGIVRHAVTIQATNSETVYLYVEPGDGVSRIASKAKNLGLARRTWHYQLATRLAGVQASMKAGEYEIAPGLSIGEQITKIASGDVFYRKVLVPEGLSVAQLEEVLIAAPGLDFQDYETPREGSILPDTYYYQRGETASQLIARMQLAQADFLEAAWAARSDNVAIESKPEALILASIVEKETGVKGERALVAGVFSNRLKKRMRLQSDPTVVYGIAYGMPLGRRLTRTDLNQETPFNTYKIRGLPPTPIANPGRAAIEAALNPADVDFLYFVADGSGGHVFAETLREHNRNVARWRKIRDGNLQD